MPALAALVPPEAVTVTFTTPALPAGELAVMVVLLITVTLMPLAIPNLSAVTPVNPVPVMVTAVPPVLSPVAGDTLVIVGGSWAATFKVYGIDFLYGPPPLVASVDKITKL